MEELQDFLNDYENIESTLQYLKNDVSDKELKKEVKELLDIFYDDYNDIYEDILKREIKLEQEEKDYQNNEYWKSQF